MRDPIFRRLPARIRGTSHLIWPYTHAAVDRLLDHAAFGVPSLNNNMNQRCFRGLSLVDSAFVADLTAPAESNLIWEYNFLFIIVTVFSPVPLALALCRI
jgi:hypothetical protein